MGGEISGELMGERRASEAMLLSALAAASQSAKIYPASVKCPSDATTSGLLVLFSGCRLQLPHVANGSEGGLRGIKARHAVA